MITQAQLVPIMPRAAHRAALFVPALNAHLPQFSIDTPRRVAAFLAQAAHESAEFERLIESLNYSSAERIREVFGTDIKTVTEARRFVRRPQELANRVYARQNGNGDVASGDGWRYRGRGIFQLTGRANYRLCGKALGLDLETSPDLLLEPENAVASACWFWGWRGLNDAADRGDLRRMTRLINGGLNGLAERNAYYQRALVALGVTK